MSLSCLYALFGMTSYKGRRSKWVADNICEWSRRVAVVFGEGQIITSKHGNISEVRGQQPFFKRCLAQPSVSTVGLMMLLYRWFFCIPTKVAWVISRRRRR